MKLIHRILTTRFLVPVFTFSLGCFITNTFTSLSCSEFQRKSNELAEKSKQFLVVLILSAPENVERRNAIRETWLNLRPHHTSEFDEHIYIPTYEETGFLRDESVDQQKQSLEMHKNWLETRQFTDGSSQVKVIHKFVIGLLGLTQTKREELLNESKNYDDLLLLDDLHDSYKNLTYKLVLSLKTLSANYFFDYLLKCDDDTYVKLDIMLTDLLWYHEKIKSRNFQPNPTPELYWGYFNGRANIKTQGQWKENHFNLCTKYLPYALGGGYVVSQGLVKYVDTNSDVLNLYMSEDISVGIWFASLRNVFRRHDCRFDTAYMARGCKDYYMVLHKRSAQDMRIIYAGKKCINSRNEDDIKKRPLEYFYDWKATPSKCCDSLVSW